MLATWGARASERGVGWRGEGGGAAHGSSVRIRNAVARECCECGVDSGVQIDGHRPSVTNRFVSNKVCVVQLHMRGEDIDRSAPRLRDTHLVVIIESWTLMRTALLLVKFAPFARSVEL